MKKTKGVYKRGVVWLFRTEKSEDDKWRAVITSTALVCIYIYLSVEIVIIPCGEIRKRETMWGNQ